MGFTPQQVDAMSMWQFQAAVNGYVEANSPKGAEKLTSGEIDDLFAWIDAPDAHGIHSTPTYRMDEDGRLIPAGVITW